MCVCAGAREREREGERMGGGACEKKTDMRVEGVLALCVSVSE